MKKVIVSFIVIILLLGSLYYFREPLYGLYRTYIDTPKEIEAPQQNAYSKQESYQLVKLTDNFFPENKQDLYNIYYTVLNAGVTDFRFYCSENYTACIGDIDALANDQEMLSTINNYVHPFNSFKHIETTYDEYGQIDIKIDHTYTNGEKTAISDKVKALEEELWTSSMTLEDKIKASHDYIINHSKYDKDRSDSNIIKYKSDTAYGTLFEGYSLCGGYTDTMALFLHDLNVNNFKISSASHVWNAVDVNNRWYHIDLTWDDPITTDGRDLLEYKFYLITTDELKKIEIEKEQHIFPEANYQEVSS